MPGAPKSPDLPTFIRYLSEYPASLPCWDVGPAERYDLLAWFNRYPIRSQHQRVAERGTELALMDLTRPHHNQLGISVRWVHSHLRDSGMRPEITNADLVKVFDLAGVAWQLTNGLADVRQGIRTFHAKDRTIELGYTGYAPFDGLDRMLGLLDDITRLPSGPPAEAESVSRLVSDGTAVGTWDSIGLVAQEEYRALATRLLERRVELPDTVRVGSGTLRDAVLVLEELFARALHAYTLALAGIEEPALSTPIVSRSRLVGTIALKTRLDREVVAEVVDLLTLDLAVCQDPCLTPLIPFGPDLALVSGLLVPGSHVRNFLARLQLDPGRYGDAGRQLGLLGSRTVAETLRDGLAGVTVIERVPVLRPDQSQAGDLDVVAFDPTTGEMLIFEVLWDIGVDGSVESGRAEQRAFGKRDQVERLQAAVAAGSASPSWPPGVFPPAAGPVHWFILTSNILPIAPDRFPGTPIRSHRLLKGLVNRHKTIAALVPVLENPPTPPASISGTSWGTLRFGQYRVQVEVLPL